MSHIISVSYTHLDVYKRQQLDPETNELLKTKIKSISIPSNIKGVELDTGGKAGHRLKQGIHRVRDAARHHKRNGAHDGNCLLYTSRCV